MGGCPSRSTARLVLDVHREKGETLMIRNEVYKPSIS